MAATPTIAATNMMIFLVDPESEDSELEGVVVVVVVPDYYVPPLYVFSEVGVVPVDPVLVPVDPAVEDVSVDDPVEVSLVPDVPASVLV